MIVKVGNGYLELNTIIEVSKKVKLLEDISTVDGDFSYSFAIPATKNNQDLIRIYYPNNSELPWNFKIPAEIQDDSGSTLYLGYIRGEKFDQQERSYQASFYSGNSTWIEDLNFPLSEVNWIAYDRDQFRDAIIDSWSRTSGIVWPLIDRGGLETRSAATVYEDDFHPFIYYKDIVTSALLKVGIKLSGDILKDPVYNKLITSNNGVRGFQKRIDQRSTKAGKNVPQTISTTTYTNVVLPNVSYPNYQSELNNWNTTTYRYTFDTDVKQAEFNIFLKLSTASLTYAQVRILYNGVIKLWDKEYRQVKLISETIEHDDLEVGLAGYATGDYIELQVKKTYSLFIGFDIVVGSYFGVKPVKFFKAFADSIVPDMSAAELLGQVFKISNTIPTYNPLSKTIDTRRFDNIAEQDSIDISEYAEVYEDNYEEFVSDYSKRNLLIWDEQSSDDVQTYNDNNDIPYGGGYIDINNDFLEAQSNLVEMDFVASFQKFYDGFGVELPGLNYVRMVETTDTKNVTSVTNNGGYAQFNHSGGSFSGLVRISNSTNEIYNGDYTVINVGGSAFLSLDLPYDTNATAIGTMLDWEDINNDDQVLLINNENVSVSDYTGVDAINFYGTGSYPDSQTRMSIANFSAFNRFKNSLVFGTVEEPNTLVGRYYRTVWEMLNIGVKSFANILLPIKIYNQIDFLRPLRYRDEKRNILYYPNRLTGYVGSKISAVIELIKLK